MKKFVVCFVGLFGVLLFLEACVSRQVAPSFYSAILNEEFYRDGDLDQAYVKYHKLYEEAVAKKKPEASEYLLKASEARQSLGEEDLAIAGYLECYQQATKLNNNNLRMIAAARLQALYLIKGQKKEADAYGDVLEKDADKISIADREWVYLQMGFLKGYSLTEDSDIRILEAHKANQKYLLKLLNTNNQQIRRRAKEDLLVRFRDLTRWLQLLNDPKEQTTFGSSLSDALTSAELYKPSENEAVTTEQGDFFEFLEVMQSEVKTWVYKPQVMPLEKKAEPMEKSKVDATKKDKKSAEPAAE